MSCFQQEKARFDLSQNSPSPYARRVQTARAFISSLFSLRLHLAPGDNGKRRPEYFRRGQMERRAVV